MHVDDSMDVFAEHGVAGIVGLIFNALFGSDAIFSLDGVNVGAVNPHTNTPVGGWLIHNYRQLYIQLAFIVAVAGYAFVVSALILFAINFIPGLKLRASEEAELLGMDDDQLGEFAYDYVEVRRDYLAWTPQKHDQNHMQDMPRSELYGCGEHRHMISLPSQREVKPQLQHPPPKEYVISPSQSSSQTELKEPPPAPPPQETSAQRAERHSMERPSTPPPSTQSTQADNGNGEDVTNEKTQ